ncbi:MAG: hypothetical protein KBD04_04410 [Proteobacteria bacterium]|nr:hypothetical protein [Pseudomonadota bacterium]
MTQKFDVVIIGSSPLCLAEAIYQVGLGHSVCVLEKGQIGGSWKYIDALGFKRVELGPHVLNGDYLGKKAMEIFGVSLQKEKLHYFDVKNKRLYKKHMDSEKYFDKAIFWLRKIHQHPISTAKIAYNLCKYFYIRFFKKKDSIFYLKGGTYELIQSFLLHPLWSKVSLQFHKCSDITFKSRTSQELSITLNSGGKIYAKKVFLTLGCNIDLQKIFKKLMGESKGANIHQTTFQSLQVLLLLRNNKKSIPFTSFIYDDSSYIGNQNFLKSKKIKYCSDITKYVAYNNSTDFQKDNLSVLALAVASSSYCYKNHELNKEKLLKDLKYYNFLDREAKIESYYMENFSGQIIDYNCVEKNKIFLENIGITVLQSDNLLNSFAKNYQRWKVLEKVVE